MKKTWLLALAGIFSATFGLAREASASITFDIRVTSVSGAGVSMVDSKHVNVTATGGTINFAIFAVISDGNSNSADDGFQSARGYVLAPANSASGPHGNLSNAALVSPFNGSGSVPGQTGTDTDGDGWTDLGTLTSSASTSIAPRSAATTFGGPDFKFETFSMTVADVGAGTSTLNFVRVGTVTTAGWTVDGQAKTISTDTVLQGADVVLSSVVGPEPASLGLLSLGGIALLARRRK